MFGQVRLGKFSGVKWVTPIFSTTYSERLLIFSSARLTPKSQNRLALIPIPAVGYHSTHRIVHPQQSIHPKQWEQGNGLPSN